MNDTVIFKVMIISMIIWIGLSVYIYYLNRKIKKLEKKLDNPDEK